MTTGLHHHQAAPATAPLQAVVCVCVQLRFLVRLCRILRAYQEGALQLGSLPVAVVSVTASFGRCGGPCIAHAHWPAKWETSLVNLPLASTGQGSSPPATVTPAGHMDQVVTQS